MTENELSYDRLIDKYISKLYQLAMNALKKNNVNKVCAALHALALLKYKWNQEYTDDIAEKYIVEIANRINYDEIYVKNKNTILFYDGFGFDTRGLALIYVKALCELGYNVIYVAPIDSDGKQGTLKRLTRGKNIVFEYILRYGEDKINELLTIFYKFKPQYAFLYTWPDDVEGCIAFYKMKDKVIRYQIDLTDHAFWLGTNSFDYCIEFRKYGACVSNNYRNILVEKIKIVPYYPYIDNFSQNEEVKVDVDAREIIFSGGSLYKTFDVDRTYYKMIDSVLEQNSKVVFLYAGEGNKSELHHLESKYPERIRIIPEVKDVSGLMRKCAVYINTYPMIGGLMTQYAAMEGKPPLTLVNCFENSLDGLLTNYNEMNLEFSAPGDLVKEVNKLLSDDNYRKQYEKKLPQCVMTEKRFANCLKNLLLNGDTGIAVEISAIDTRAFRKQYVERFSYYALTTQIINKKTFKIWIYFPELLMRRFMFEIKKYYKTVTA